MVAGRAPRRLLDFSPIGARLRWRMSIRFRTLIAAVMAGTLVVPAAQARKPRSLVDQVVEAYQSTQSSTVPAAGTVEVAFSPNEGSEHLVIKVIDSATRELDLLSYSFTSVPVVEALVRARHRGVVVRLVADQKDNVSADRSGKAHAALGALVSAGAEVRTISVYAIHHDKVIIADRQTVELGSFNYSDAAAHRNSENVLVNWGNPKLAEVYLQHFERNRAQATLYAPGY
jgi:phosphatidylserine/phosphatidylglycerophosphate/cardiolipin synthase-like enzyme